jgi:CheY-like chemotaxis protein
MFDYIEPASGGHQNPDTRAIKSPLRSAFVKSIDLQGAVAESIDTVLDENIKALQQHVTTRLGDRCFMIEVLPEAREFLLQRGDEFGPCELKRTFHRQLTQPLATKVVRGGIQPGALVRVAVDHRTETLSMHQIGSSARTVSRPAILITDENHSLLLLLASDFKDAGWEISMADNASRARRQFSELPPGVVLIDYMLGYDDGLKLGLEFQIESPATQIVLMTGGRLPDAELALCGDRDIPILFKPFLSNEVLNLIKRPLRNAFDAKVGFGW